MIYAVSRQVLYLSGWTGINIFVWYNIILIVFEIFIIFIEAIFYYKKIDFSDKYIFYKQKNKFYSFFLMSLILNISSIIVGRFIG